MGIKTRMTPASIVASCKLRAGRSSFGEDLRKCSLQTGTLDASRNVSAIERRYSYFERGALVVNCFVGIFTY